MNGWYSYGRLIFCYFEILSIQDFFRCVNVWSPREVKSYGFKGLVINILRLKQIFIWVELSLDLCRRFYVSEVYFHLVQVSLSLPNKLVSHRLIKKKLVPQCVLLSISLLSSSFLWHSDTIHRYCSYELFTLLFRVCG